MSIRPVDMQVIVQKTQEVHHAKQTVVSKLDNELVNVQIRTKEDTIKSHHTVYNTERSEMKTVKNDEETTEERKKRKQKEQSDENAQTERDRNENGRIDREGELNRKVCKAGARFDMKV